jgi:hypothetical protein
MEPAAMNHARTIGTALLFGSLVLLATGACAGPERATRVRLDDTTDSANREYERKEEEARRDAEDGPRDTSRSVPAREPIEVERDLRDDGEPSSPARTASASTWRDEVDAFAEDLVAATDGIRGAVVVFPLLTRSNATRRWSVPAIGDDVAADIAVRLTAARRDVLVGAELEQAILAANRGLDALVEPTDAIGLAQRLSGLFSVGAVVTGSFDVIERNGLSGERKVNVALQASKLPGGAPLARRRFAVDGTRAAVALVEELQDPGRWRIGADAEPFRPSADREFSVVATAALAELLEPEPDLVLDRRVLVLPLEVPALASAERQLTRNAALFDKEFSRIERQLAEQGADDPFTAAMESPIEFDGKRWATAGQALVDLQEMRDKAYGDSRAGRLAEDLSQDLSDALRRVTGGRVTIVSSDDRATALAIVKSEALESQLEASLVESGIAAVETEGGQVVVRTSVRRGIEDVALRIRVLDLADPNRSRQTTVTLPRWLGEELDRLLGR